MAPQFSQRANTGPRGVGFPSLAEALHVAKHQEQGVQAEQGPGIRARPVVPILSGVVPTAAWDLNLRKVDEADVDERGRPAVAGRRSLAALVRADARVHDEQRSGVKPVCKDAAG